MTITRERRADGAARGADRRGLLGQLKIRREYTAVALNREVWPKSRYAETVLKDGDRVEIVRPMGGG